MLDAKNSVANGTCLDHVGIPSKEQQQPAIYCISMSASHDNETQADNTNNSETDDRLKVSQCCKEFLQYHWRGLIVLLTPIAFSFLLFRQPIQQMRCAYVLAVMAMYWMTEALPLPITSILPIVAFPLMGIMESNAVCQQYFQTAVAFFFFSMIVASALEYSNIHKRLALCVIALVGCEPKRLHFSVTLLTMFVSMWIANAACTTLMCPIVKAILQELHDHGHFKLHKDKKLGDEEDVTYPTRVATCYYLGVAYATSIGGCGTMMGSNVNLIFTGIFTERFPQANDMDFTHFTAFNLPIVIVTTILVALWLEFYFMGLGRASSSDAQAIQLDVESVRRANEAIRQKKAMAEPVKINEILIAVLFFTLIILLFTQNPGIFRGWADLFNAQDLKSSVATGTVVLLIFIIPGNYYFLKYFLCRAPKVKGPSKSLLSWQSLAKKLPWGTMLMLGGGMALSAGIVKSNLSVLIGESLKMLNTLPTSVVQLASLCICTIFTAFCANAALCSILTPILFEMAIVIKVHPAFISLPASMITCLAFHFPMSTGPNAIVSEYANVQTKDMCLAGIAPSVIGILAYFVFSQFWGPIIFNDFNGLPDWMR